ncbi:MAG TPA: hypothetical protein VFR71_08475, partial [Methyloceanibacter sp.]|nr:hypothetical protein [Methyloceanibacter sp.]
MCWPPWPEWRGALLGWLVVGLLADLLLGLGGMSDREGYRAMIAFFTFGPFGGLAGLILGIWLVLRYFGGYTGLAGIVRARRAGGRCCRRCRGTWALGLYAFRRPPGEQGPSKFELRLPANTTLPAELAGVSMDLNTDKNTMPAVLTDTRVRGCQAADRRLGRALFRHQEPPHRPARAGRARSPVRAQT